MKDKDFSKNYDNNNNNKTINQVEIKNEENISDENTLFETLNKQLNFLNDKFQVFESFQQMDINAFYSPINKYKQNSLHNEIYSDNFTEQHIQK